MNALFLLIPIAVLMGGAFCVAFLLAVKDGQFDDLDDPPERILRD